MPNEMKVRMSWSRIEVMARKRVMEVLESGWLSRHKYIPRFEEEVAKKHQAKYGVLVSSGTDALRISLSVLREVYRWKDGSEVIVPALTFVATVNAILQTRLKPIFCDVELPTGNLKPSALLFPSKSIVAAVPVHLFGLPVAIPKTRLSVVEDSCEAFGVHKIQGDMACFSFYMSHHIATGVGGMILTNNKRYAELARSYQNHGRIDDGTHFKFGRSGYSSRLTEMEAALGVEALASFEEELDQRRSLARHYIFNLQMVEEIQKPPMAVSHSWMFYPVKLREGNRDKLLQHLRRKGIESREAMPLINQPVFRDLYKKGSCPNAEDWTKNGLLLPLHPQMSEGDVAYVCSQVERFFNGSKS
jgi:dTDP-4-amino-4,6-dideoxygalactose transaminase